MVKFLHNGSACWAPSGMLHYLMLHYHYLSPYLKNSHRAQLRTCFIIIMASHEHVVTYEKMYFHFPANINVGLEICSTGFFLSMLHVDYLYMANIMACWKWWIFTFPAAYYNCNAMDQSTKICFSIQLHFLFARSSVNYKLTVKKENKNHIGVMRADSR